MLDFLDPEDLKALASGVSLPGARKNKKKDLGAGDFACRKPSQWDRHLDLK